MVDTYRARRRVKIGPELWREPGELVPEAHTWYRRESIEHTGMIVAAKDVPEDEFRAAIAQHCPELAAQIYELTGLDGTALTGAQGTPIAKPPAPAKPAAKPVKKAAAKKPEPAPEPPADAPAADAVPEPE